MSVLICTETQGEVALSSKNYQNCPQTSQLVSNLQDYSSLRFKVQKSPAQRVYFPGAHQLLMMNYIWSHYILVMLLKYKLKAHLFTNTILPLVRPESGTQQSFPFMSMVQSSQQLILVQAFRRSSCKVFIRIYFWPHSLKLRRLKY